MDKKTKFEAQWKNIVKLGFITNIVAHNFNIGNGTGGHSDILMIDKNNCHMATWLQLDYTIGIDHQQLNGNYIVDNS